MERVAIVTGGSRGRGREVARELAARGYAVVVGYADGQRDADAAVEEILAAGGAAVAIRADLVDALDVDRLFDETVEAFGGIDLVVHAAAGTRSVVDARAARHAPEAVAVVDAGQRDQGSPGGRAAAGRRDGDGIPTSEDTMTSTDVTSDAGAGGAAGAIDLKLEVVVLPVSNVDRAKAFYQSLGWRLDAEFSGDAGFRVVQLTPPGSPTSIIFGSHVTSAAPGSADGLMLVVEDIAAAREALVARGVDVSEVFHDAGGVFHHAGTDGRVPGPAPDRQSYGSFASFSDPDGNGWVMQEVTTRLPGRVSTTDVATLAELLHETAEHHDPFEKAAPPHDWWDWYAAYLDARIRGETSDTASAVAGRYMDEVRHVVVG